MSLGPGFPSSHACEASPDALVLPTCHHVGTSAIQVPRNRGKGLGTQTWRRLLWGHGRAGKLRVGGLTPFSPGPLARDGVQADCALGLFFYFCISFSKRI